MKLEKVSTLAELVTAVAVLVTLGYLSVQTRQNTAAIESAVRQNVLSAEQLQIYEFIEYPSLNKRTGLTAEEKVQVSAHIVALLRTREIYWLQYKNGVLDGETWVSYRRALLPVVFTSEYGRAVWANLSAGGSFNSEFRRHIDDWVAGLDIIDQDQVLYTPGAAN